MFSRKNKQAVATAASSAGAVTSLTTHKKKNNATGIPKKKVPPAAANLGAEPTTARQKGGFLKRIKKKREGTDRGLSEQIVAPSPASARRTTAVEPPSPALLAQKATTNPGRQHPIDSQQFILQCMKEAGYITAVQEKFVFLRRPNLIRTKDPEVINYPAGLDTIQQGSIVGYFDATDRRVYHCMMVVAPSSDSNSAGRLFLAGIDNRRVLHPIHSCDRSYAKHSVVTQEQLKKLPCGTTVRYQSMDTIRQRLLTQPSDHMDSSSISSEEEEEDNDDLGDGIHTIEKMSDAESSFDSFQNWSEEESLSSVSVNQSSDEDKPSDIKFRF